jgi:hypothetical protein
VAANYYVYSQLRSVRVISSTYAQNVEIVGIKTLPTQLYVEYPVDLKDWADTQGRDVLEPLAAQIEQQISEGLATGGSFAQDVDENGLLVDYFDFIVTYYPPGGVRGSMTTIVRIPVETLLAATDPFFAALGGSAQSQLSAAYDNLKRTAEQ